MTSERQLFVHRYTTRKLWLLLPALVLGCAGACLFCGALWFLFTERFDTGLVMMVIVSGMFLLFGVYYTIRFFWPLDAVSEISEDGIVCRLNGNVRYDFRRGDVAAVEVSLGAIDYIYVDFADGRRVRVQPMFFQNFDRLRADLKTCGYRVVES